MQEPVVGKDSTGNYALEKKARTDIISQMKVDVFRFGKPSSLALPWFDIVFPWEGKIGDKDKNWALRSQDIGPALNYGNYVACRCRLPRFNVVCVMFV